MMSPTIPPPCTTIIRLRSSEKTRTTALLSSMTVSQSTDLASCAHESTQCCDSIAALDDRCPETREIRQGMISFIANLIQQKGAASRNKSSVYCMAVAQVVERHLLKQAKSLEEYADKESLDSRLRHLLSQHLRRRLHSTTRVCRRRRTCSVVQPNCNQRKHLELMLGNQFTEAINLLREIQSLKLQRASVDCCLGECQRHATRPSALPTNMPIPVRSLFFETDLVPALACSIANDKVANIRWSELIQQAKQNIHAYREWCQSGQP